MRNEPHDSNKEEISSLPNSFDAVLECSKWVANDGPVILFFYVMRCADLTSLSTPSICQKPLGQLLELAMMRSCPGSFEAGHQNFDCL